MTSCTVSPQCVYPFVPFPTTSILRGRLGEHPTRRGLAVLCPLPSGHLPKAPGHSVGAGDVDGQRRRHELPSRKGASSPIREGAKVWALALPGPK